MVRLFLGGRVALVALYCAAHAASAEPRLADFPPSLREVIASQARDLAEEGTAFVAGRVWLGDGAQIRGAEDVQVNLHVGADLPFELHENGWFLLRRPVRWQYAGRDGTMVLRAFGYEPIDGKITLRAGEVTYVEYELTPMPTGRLATLVGTVIDDRDHPIAGASVTLCFPLANFGYTRDGHSYPPMRVLTDRDGVFWFSGLPSTELSLTIMSRGRERFHQRFTPKPGETVEVHGKLFPGRSIRLEYVFQDDGGRDFTRGDLKRGRLIWRPGQAGLNFSSGRIENSYGDDPLDLELRQTSGTLEFEIRHLSGANGMYDAGNVPLESIKFADVKGFVTTPLSCVKGHSYVVITHDHKYAKFVVLDDDVPANPAKPNP